jgi:glycosyltransferase involved in cell wall biosynthesis
MRCPTLSVVIPAYNSGRYLVQAIKSAASQTVPPSEIIVVDDGSTDDTRERLAPYAGRVTYIPQENQGASAARNRGVEAATGELIAFLDADDVWHPRKTEIQLQAMAERPELGLLGSGTFDWPTREFPAVAPQAAVVRPISWSHLVVRTTLATSSVIARRRTLERVGPFDVTLQGPEDRDLFLRVAEVTAVAEINLALTGYRNSPGSLSKQVKTCEMGMRKILRRLDDRGAWGSCSPLRRKSYSYMYHNCSYLHGALRDYPRALAYQWRSFGWYPLPYHPDEVSTAFERPKRLAVNVLRWLRLKSPEPQPLGTFVDGSSDALDAIVDPFLVPERDACTAAWSPLFGDIFGADRSCDRSAAGRPAPE